LEDLRIGGFGDLGFEMKKEAAHTFETASEILKAELLS
jgi:hypothetical protein